MSGVRTPVWVRQSHGITFLIAFPPIGQATGSGCAYRATPTFMSRTLWAVVDEQLTLRQWGGETECVAFSPLSGDVHLISVAARVLLETLARQPLDRDELVVRLAEASRRPVDEQWAAAVDAALTMLDRAGLIEPRVS